MVNINWIKCNDQMPPDDWPIIAKLSELRPILVMGSSLLNIHKSLGLNRDWEWLPYTDFLWKQLISKER